MQLFMLPSLALVAMISGAAIEKRQGVASLGDIFSQLKGSSMSPAKIIDIAPVTRQNAKRQQVRYGPFTVPAQKVWIHSTFLG
jgi:hypothetical protein